MNEIIKDQLLGIYRLEDPQGSNLQPAVALCQSMKTSTGTFPFIGKMIESKVDDD
jgi:hypothetical protein